MAEVVTSEALGTLDLTTHAEVRGNVLRSAPETLRVVAHCGLRRNRRAYHHREARDGEDPGSESSVETAPHGRIRRGDPSHYGKGADKLTAIVDRTALRLRPYYSDHFKACLVEM